jgi:uncharacterized membrane protein YfcA
LFLLSPAKKKLRRQELAPAARQFGEMQPNYCGVFRGAETGGDPGFGAGVVEAGGWLSMPACRLVSLPSRKARNATSATITAIAPMMRGLKGFLPGS